jgi:hypothetical protein|tara:strand:- start:753 stop:950 length:198 start_codon:yes stop_codon:yes gene_type:complete
VFVLALTEIFIGEALPSSSEVQQAKSTDKRDLALAITKLSIPLPTGPVFFSFLTHFLMELAESWN